MPERIVALCVFAAALGWAATARADEPAPVPAQEAFAEHEAVFRAGLEQYGRGNYVAAIATWESLVGTMGEERGYKVLYNLGLAYQQVGDATKAIDRHRAFQRQVELRPDATPELRARAADAAKRAGELEASHGAVTIAPPKKGGIVLTRVDTAEPRTAGYTVWLAPGTHAIEVHVGTEHAKRVTLAIAAGTTTAIDTTPDWAEPVAPLPPPSPPPDRVPTLVWIGAAATAVSLALPITLHAIASGKRDDADALGAGHTDYAAKRDTYQSWRTGYYVSYALPIGLGLATAAVYLLRPEPAAATGVRAVVGPGGGGIEGRF